MPTGDESWCAGGLDGNERRREGACGGFEGPEWIAALRRAFRSLPIALDFKKRVLERLVEHPARTEQSGKRPREGDAEWDSSGWPASSESS